MAITSTEVAELLDITTANSKYDQISYVLPYIIVQVNDYCNGGFSRQVKEEQVTTAATTTSRQITNYPIVKGTVYVTSTDRGTYYYGDTQYGNVPIPDYYIPSTYARDYDILYSTGGFISSTAAGSRIPASTYVYVTYSYIDIVDGGKLAIARLCDQIVNQPTGGIASETVGILSRTYVSGGVGFEPLVKNLLAPYRRIKVV